VTDPVNITECMCGSVALLDLSMPKKDLLGSTEELTKGSSST